MALALHLALVLADDAVKEFLGGRGVEPLAVAVAVDDVGSGYAGMRQLVVLEPEAIKLDAFVVHGMKGNRVKSALAELVLEFARQTDARCVFEGIETDEDLEAARSIGADLLQGFRVGRPAAL